jgi:hypothetical protein
MADEGRPETPFDQGLRIRGLGKRGTFLTWEPPIDHRAKDLVRLVRDEGAENTTKSELVAALVLAATENPEELSRLLRKYRKAKVADAQVRGGQIVSLDEKRRPGPIPRTS